MLSIGSLCSGIGLMDLGLEYAGLGPVRYQVEIDPFCRAVLAKHWPEAKRYDDVRTIDAAALEPVDLICFGSPCQDLSSAGSRAGLGGPKSRIFYDCLRVLEAARPQWVVFENVASGASRWVDAVRSELEQLGYATLPIPVAASWLGAWQQRARVFVVAQLERGRRHAWWERSPAARRAIAEGCDCGHSAEEHGFVGPDIRSECGSCSCAKFQPRAITDADGDWEEAIACLDREPVRVESRRSSRENRARASVASQHGAPDAADANRDREHALAEHAEVAAACTSTNAVSTRREGPGTRAHEGRSRPPADHWRSLRTDMVRVVHGRARNLDGARSRIAALGNAPTPQQVEVIGYIVRELAGLTGEE